MEVNHFYPISCILKQNYHFTWNDRTHFSFRVYIIYTFKYIKVNKLYVQTVSPHQNTIPDGYKLQFFNTEKEKKTTTPN